MIPTALTERETAKLTELATDKRVLEIGSLFGHSTIALAKSAIIVHAVDPHEGYPEDNSRSTLETFLTNLSVAGVRDKVVVHLCRDDDVPPFFYPGLFDLVFIDVTGKYEDTRMTMFGAYRVLKPDGVLAVHDCGHPDWSGVEKAVQEFSWRLGNKTYELVDRLAIFNFKAVASTQ